MKRITKLTCKHDEEKFIVNLKVTIIYKYQNGKKNIRIWELNSSRHDFFHGTKLNIKQVKDYVKWYVCSFGTCVYREDNV